MCGVHLVMAFNHGFRRAMVLLLVLFTTCSAFPCSCGAPGPACAYITTASVVFVGTPVYTNEDHSGTFVQQTLYRFEVEEIFKGLREGTKEVWIDPGSFTSCYAVYKLGTKLLVFASQGSAGFGDSAAMTVAAPGKHRKPLPPGFDPKMPVYYAPECNGTRPVEFAAADLAWLRTWQQGKTNARIYGEFHDDFGFPLRGVKVTATGRQGLRTAITDADGLWSMDRVRPGKYLVTAELSSYRLGWNPESEIAENACAYLRMQMEGSGATSGTVLDSHHKPLAGIEMVIGRVSDNGDLNIVRAPVTSASDGSFVFRELPAGNFVVGVNLNFSPSIRTPYAKTYLPGVIKREQAQVLHLDPGQKISGLHMQMPPAMRQRTLRVRVTWPDGRSVGKGVSVSADTAGDGDFESADTDGNGIATLKCLATLSYEITAQKWLSKLGENPPRKATSTAKNIAAGTEPGSITLVLSKTITGYGK